jgi:hypothetical protein
MIVIYRITSVSSSNPSPILYEDKLRLNRLCLRSFREGFIDVCPHTIFIADKCDDKQISMIENEMRWSFEIIRTDLGINETMVKSYELAIRYDDQVLFQECDYLYQPVIGEQFTIALDELKLVSPYDHLNFYKDKSIHSEECRVRVVGEHHFRTTERNTMTWATHTSVVEENLEFLTHHGYLDVGVWEDFRYAGYPLWVPIPSFATHMVKDYLAPGINWSSLWKKYL